jgi:WD40 repeat protein
LAKRIIVDSDDEIIYYGLNSTLVRLRSILQGLFTFGNGEGGSEQIREGAPDRDRHAFTSVFLFLRPAPLSFDSLRQFHNCSIFVSFIVFLLSIGNLAVMKSLCPSGLITPTRDIALHTINADGARLARARGNTIETLHLTALNEQGDPPILGTFQAARPFVMRLVFAPDGKTIAVVSQAVRDDIGPALLEMYDMQRLRPFRSWEVSGVSELSFSPDNRWLARSVDFGTGTSSNYAIDPDVGNASEFTIPGQGLWENATFSADSQVLAAAAEKEQIVFWTIPGGTLLRSWDIYPACCVVSDLALDPRGLYLAMSSPEGLELRGLADGTLAGYASQQVHRIAFVARGTDLFLTGMHGDGAVMIWWIDQ